MMRLKKIIFALSQERLNGGQSPLTPQPNVGSYFVLPVDSPIWNSFYCLFTEIKIFSKLFPWAGFEPAYPPTQDPALLWAAFYCLSQKGNNNLVSSQTLYKLF